jgi:hypothetical protein
MNRSFLEALEKDDFNFFPQREFIAGFLRGYARYLGLDSEEVLKRYRVQTELQSRKETYRQLSLFPEIPPAGEEAEEPEKESTKSSPPKEEKRNHRNLIIKLAVVLIALSLSLYLHYLLKEMETRPANPNSKPVLSPRDRNKGLEPLSYKAKIIGNPSNQYYYLPGMKDYGNTDPAHRMEFDSEEEAIKAGFRLAPQEKNPGRK